MNPPTLRALARALASGALDRASYRAQRRDLLLQVVNGEMPVHAYQPPEPEARTQFPSDYDDADTTQEIIAPIASMRAAATPAGSRMAVWLALLALALAGGGWLAWQPLRTEQPPPATLTASATDSDVIERFLGANNWHGPALAALQTAWDAQDAVTQERVRQAPAMRRLTEQVAAQIQAESALLGLGDAEEALATQEQLLDLMEHFGVSNERLARARADWRSARAEHQAKGAAPATLPPTPAVATDIATSTDALSAPASESAPAAASPAPATTVAAAKVVPIPAATTAAIIPAAAEPAPAATVTATGAATASMAVAPPPSAATVTVPEPVTKRTPAKRSNCKADLAKTRRPFCIDLLADGGKGPALVVLTAGEFQMGGEQPEEQPQHAVKIERPFAMGMFEISGAEFAAFCTATGAPCPAQPWTNPALPVVNVPWALATAYTTWLSKVTGARYQLPSEAQWEYAVRAGTRTATPFGSELLPTHARYSFKNAETTPLAANDRSVNHNDFRLYHMLGNVREWVLDAWNANYAGAAPDGRARDGNADAEHVARGGSYADGATALRSSARGPVAASGDRYTGFRVVRSVE